MLSKIKSVLITAIMATTLFASLTSTASEREVFYRTHYTYVPLSEAMVKFRNDFEAKYPGVQIIYTSCYYPPGAIYSLFICEGKGRI
ncbi:hypothetical protein [Pseudoalteromonas luteoviolacea]|uniref:Uncharacterized protein n=1 Tax=Pseudoalteromonas luteoviolacea H33 TaxID=1365251 RepID=A0A167DD97_9GAMM|nr:hypothetical protein [Pseudoalteromonas luteoviolacea]KZN48694.1 hypothetical protein N476_21000 [Pseudoalteromonas luteoviolacea H33]KZN75471.1 hypothetical protein N477_01785 [Pseudoalteromonas luteoviolacea H33-S]